MAEFICRGRSQAVLIIAVFALLALAILPLFPLIVISGAALALVTLSNNLNTTLVVFGIAFGLCVLLLTPIGLVKQSYILLMFWIPIVIGAEVLRRSKNLALALLTLLMLVSAAVVAFLAVVSDPIALWYKVFGVLQQIPELASQVQLSQEQIDIVVVVMTGFVASTSLLLIATCLLLGRWWQGRLVNPGGFQREFNSLNLGKVLSAVAVVLIVAATLFGTQLLIALSAVFVVIFLFQGLAVIHAFTANQVKLKIWLVVFYVVMLIVKELLLMVSLFGIVDCWLDCRRRWLPRYQ